MARRKNTKTTKWTASSKRPKTKVKTKTKTKGARGRKVKVIKAAEVKSVPKQIGHQRVAVLFALVGLTLGSIGFFGLASLSLFKGIPKETTKNVLHTANQVTVHAADASIVKTQAGFPAALDGVPVSSGAAFDIDGNGTLEIVEGTSTGCVYVFSSDGTQFGSSPRAKAPVDSSATTHCQKASPTDPWPIQLSKDNMVVGMQPKPAQLDDDENLEFVIGTWRITDNDPADAKLYALNDDGSLLWQTPITCGQYCTSPAVADINGDGKDELFFSTENSGTNTTTILGLQSDGTMLSGWPKKIPGGYAVVSVEDMTGNGTYDVFATTGSQIFGFTTAGNQLKGWPQAGGAMALGDVQGDSQKEIVTIIEGDPIEGGLRHAYTLRIYDIKGNIIATPKWNSQTLVAPEDASYLPLLANLDAVGSYEIVVADTNANLVYAFHGDGSLVYGWPQSALTSPWLTVGDINKNGHVDVILSASSNDLTRYTAFTGDGDLVPGFPLTVSSGGVQPLNADLEGNGIVELLFPTSITQSDGSVVSYLNAISLAATNTKIVTSGAETGWRMWGRDTHNAFRYSE